ncbi:MAG: tRNA epoxyqueuosine(34) reductase QueG [Polyangiaceae bacterium]|nr:tRNA epoxyqueuosine(34) reductase QueG [Polyangiaceae bacterium]
MKSARVPTEVVPEGESVDDKVRRFARRLGFDAVGVARADEPIELEHARYEAFIAEGRHGEMHYLATGSEARKRLDSEFILSGAKSVVCVAMRYARPDEEARGVTPLIARYARGRDYHGFMKKRLRKLADFVRTLGEGVQARALCDIEPVMERVWAVRAGLGFVGKNGLLITPGQGSYSLLGEVVTTLPLLPDTAMNERCGSCTRCLDACPTNAFTAPFVLDPRRCVSYATIEAKSTPEEDVGVHMGEHLFGCDDCQSVCPFNRTAMASVECTQPFAPFDVWQTMRLPDAVTMDVGTFERVSVGSPMRRAGRAGLARNAALLAAGRLAAGKETEEDVICLRAALDHDEPAVRSVAERALGGRDSGRDRL